MTIKTYQKIIEIEVASRMHFKSVVGRVLCSKKGVTRSLGLVAKNENMKIQLESIWKSIAKNKDDIPKTFRK